VSATYRIEVSETDNFALYGWEAKITRLDDEWPVRIEHRDSAGEAMDAARKWLAADNAYTAPLVVYVDDQGRDAEAPQSVKV
jgi:hypothetical protein